MSLLSEAKSAGVRVALNTLLKKEYGEITTLEIDPAKRAIRAALLLHGESDLIDIEISSYELIEEQGERYFVAHYVHISRTWLQALGQRHLQGERLRLPENLSPLAKILLA